MTDFIGRILGVDLGTRRIGLALSDPLGLTAQPLPTLQAESREAGIREVSRIAAEHEVQSVIVGLPLRMDGRAGPEARRAERFAEELRMTTGLMVRTWDERLTTAISERSLIESGRSRKKRQTVIDSAASILILQNYLDYLKNKKPA